MPELQYELGHVKHNVETGDVAIRTIFPEDQSPQLAAMAWLVATAGQGARHTTSDDVKTWDDLFIPEVVVTPPPPGGLPMPNIGEGDEEGA
jgi:hypothetical protein